MRVAWNRQEMHSSVLGMRNARNLDSPKRISHEGNARSVKRSSQTSQPQGRTQSETARVSIIPNIYLIWEYLSPSSWYSSLPFLWQISLQRRNTHSERSEVAIRSWSRKILEKRIKNMSMRNTVKRNRQTKNPAVCASQSESKTSLHTTFRGLHTHSISEKSKSQNKSLNSSSPSFWVKRSVLRSTATDERIQHLNVPTLIPYIS